MECLDDIVSKEGYTSHLKDGVSGRVAYTVFVR